MMFPFRHDRNAVQVTKKVLPLNKYAGGLPMSRVTSPFGIFLNFNFPKNTFKFSKSHRQDTLQRDKTRKKLSILSVKIFGIPFNPSDPKI